MERKIGEIFEYNGEWYQCVVGIQGCRGCSFRTQDYCTRLPECLSIERSDKKSVVFKKLEKVGEPYEYYVSKKGIIQVQDYLLADPNHIVYNKIEGVYDYLDDKVVIEIKQTKEDMKEKKLNLKPFSLELAKAGKPVCTRDGRKARIICFDAKGEKPIIALIANGNSEDVNYYYITGKVRFLDKEDENDLMMLPEKKEGWVNVYKKEQNRYVKGIFPSREIALNSISEKSREYIATIKITWEE